MINRTTLILYLCIVLFISSCDNSNQKLWGYISSTSLYHVIKLRDGCKFTELYFNVVVWNSTAKEKKIIDISSFDSYCDRNLDKSDLQLKVNGQRYYLAVEKDHKDVFIAAKSSVILRCRLMHKLEGLSLEDIISINDQLFTENVIVSFTINHDCVQFTTVPSFKINYFLDEVLVDSNDSSHWFMSTPGPPAELLFPK